MWLGCQWAKIARLVLSWVWTQLLTSKLHNPSPVLWICSAQNLALSEHGGCSSTSSPYEYSWNTCQKLKYVHVLCFIYNYKLLYKWPIQLTFWALMIFITISWLSYMRLGMCRPLFKWSSNGVTLVKSNMPPRSLRAL